MQGMGGCKKAYQKVNGNSVSTNYSKSLYRSSELIAAYEEVSKFVQILGAK